MNKVLVVVAAFLLAGCAMLGGPRTITVSHDGHGDHQTLQSAIDALPEKGGDILLAPGTYREKVFIKKNGVHIRGTGANPRDTVIVYDDSAAKAGGTSKSPTMDVTGDDFHLSNVTVQNDYWLKPENKPSQAVALAVSGDKAVITRVRLLGHQDTLYAKKGPNLRMSRQYYSDCYIEGHVDFIFGNAKAYFSNCQLHGLASSSVMYTAQSKNSPDEDSAYVFDHCVLTADPGAREISLGRAWRPYATVIYRDTIIDAPVIPEGWREWTPGKTDTLRTATYAEYNSSGPGASPLTREPYSHQLTDAEAAKWSLKAFFGGDLSWIPGQEESLAAGP